MLFSFIGNLSSQNLRFVISAIAIVLAFLAWWKYRSEPQFRHLRKLPAVRKSNLIDQHDEKYSVPEDTTTKQSITIKALFIHPIKSCKPIEVDRTRLTKAGLEYDRCFAFAIRDHKTNPDASLSTDWRFVTQRTKPLMSQIHTELWLPQKGADSNDPQVQSGGCLVVKFRDPEANSGQQVSFTIPLEPTPTQIAEYGLTLKEFVIQTRRARGLDMSVIPGVAAALPKLKKLISIPDRQHLTLFRWTQDTLALTEDNFAPLRHIGSPAVHGYTDEQPLHISSLASAHAVSKFLPPENQPLDIHRFRANIVISGAAAFTEETWKRCRILPKSRTESRNTDALTLSIVCRTARCTMPNVNPQTGIPDRENPAPDKKKGKPQPSTTLTTQRMVETNNSAALGYFGVHGVPEASCFGEDGAKGAGTYLQVGDEIEVLETGVHTWGTTSLYGEEGCE